MLSIQVYEWDSGYLSFFSFTASTMMSRPLSVTQDVLLVMGALTTLIHRAALLGLRHIALLPFPQRTPFSCFWVYLDCYPLSPSPGQLPLIFQERSHPCSWLAQVTPLAFRVCLRISLRGCRVWLDKLQSLPSCLFLRCQPPRQAQGGAALLCIPGATCSVWLVKLNSSPNPTLPKTPMQQPITCQEDYAV